MVYKIFSPVDVPFHCLGNVLQFVKFEITICLFFFCANGLGSISKNPLSNPKSSFLLKHYMVVEFRSLLHFELILYMAVVQLLLHGEIQLSEPHSLKCLIFLNPEHSTGLLYGR